MISNIGIMNTASEVPPPCKAHNGYNSNRSPPIHWQKIPCYKFILNHTSFCGAFLFKHNWRKRVGQQQVNNNFIKPKVQMTEYSCSKDPGAHYEFGIHIQKLVWS